jgi:iron complex outermembrane receptor protein
MVFRRLIWPLIICCFTVFISSAQVLHRFDGLVVDENDLALPGAVVNYNNGESITVTGKEGRFHFIREHGKQVLLQVSFMGYHSYSKLISLDSLTGTLKISLSPAAQQLNEVVISDRYAEQRRKEEPQSVEVVNQEYMRQNLSGSLMKTLERLPGLTTMDIGSGQSKPVIRGLGFNRVVVADQGVKHESQQWGADHGLEIDQFAVERAEVIKGPGSLMYGSDAIGGLIELSQVTIPEEHVFGGNVNLSGKSNNGLLGGSVQVFGRSTEWYVKGRFTAVDYGDYRVPVDSVTINSYRVPLDNHRLRNTAGEEFDAHLTIGLIRKRFTTSVYISDIFTKAGFFANAHGIMPLTTDSTYDRSNRDIQLPFQWVNHLKLISRSVLFHGHWKTETELGFQNNYRQELSRYIGHGYMPAVLPDSLGFPSDLAREFRKNTFSWNLRTSRVVFSNHSVTGGFNAEYQVNRIGGWSFIIPSFDQVSAGIFLIDKVRLNEHLLIQGGIRYDVGYVVIQGYTDWFKTPVFSGADTTWSYAQRATPLNRSFGNFCWSAGLSYSKSAITLKANIGKSFRMPIPKELAVNGVNYHYFIYEKGDPDLSPEISYQLDAGLEWTIPKFAIEISPFVNYFPNYIFLNPTYLHDYTYGAGNQVYQYTQGEVFRFGGEIHLHNQIFRRLMAGLIVEYVYSRQLSGDKKGFTLPFSPPPSMLIDLKYTPNLGKHLINAFISIDMNLTAPQNQIVPPEQKTPGYTDVDISIGSDIRIGKQSYTVNLRLQNLFNTVYYNHTSFYRLMDVPEPGRNFSLNILIPFEKATKTTTH